MFRLSKRYSLILLVILTLVNAIFCLENRKEFSNVVGSELVTVSDIISQDNLITQTVCGNGKYLKEIIVFISTHNRENEGTLSISIIDGETVLFEKNIPTGGIQDNSFVSFKCNDIQMENGKDYVIKISAVNIGETGVSVWRDGSDKLVCTFVTQKGKVTIEGLIKLNITFAISGYFVCRILQAIRRK